MDRWRRSGVPAFLAAPTVLTVPAALAALAALAEPSCAAARIAEHMHPYIRFLVIGAVAMVITGILIVLGLLGRDTQVSVWSLLVAGVIAIVVGGLLFVESWIWSQRSWRGGYAGRSAAIAVVGGLAILVAAGALAATVILLLTFGLG